MNAPIDKTDVYPEQDSLTDDAQDEEFPPVTHRDNVFVGGVRALRDVRHATHMTEQASRLVAELQQTLDEDRQELDRRSTIELSYPHIVEESTQAREKAREDERDARARSDLAGSHRHDLSQALDTMRAEHEEKLSPYRNIMESTKGRADDSSRALAETRRQTKAAEAQVSDAVKQRDQRISGANRAVDTAQDRLRKIDAELDRVKQQQDCSPTALTKLQHERVAAQAHVDAAKQDVVTITAEEQSSVDSAQEHLWQQKQALELAERQASETKQEANARKEEYDRLYKQAMAEEDELKTRISSCDKDLAQAERDIEEAAARARQAQETLDEANDIHTTPDTTAQLKERIEEEEAELADREAEADRLADEERTLRSSTLGRRIIFLALMVVLVLIILVVVYVLFFHSGTIGSSVPRQ